MSTEQNVVQPIQFFNAKAKALYTFGGNQFKVLGTNAKWYIIRINL